MNSETKLVVDLWDYMRDVIPAGKRTDAAIKMLDLFQEYGYEVSSHELEGECEYLDEALEAFLDEDRSEDDDEEEQDEY
jgi:hypothetical protein